MTSPQPFRFEFGRVATAGSRQGPKHERNEDSLCIAEPESEELLESHGDLYIVADGVGGHSQGAVASALAVEIARSAYYAGTRANAADNLTAAIEEANVRVYESGSAGADPDHGMATTIVAAVVLHDQVIVANVGDSRAYLTGGGSLRQLSHDHSWVQEAVDSGRLTAEEARHSSRRNVITRALGLGRQVESATNSDARSAGNGRLVLCTDGVHGVLEDSELTEIIQGFDRREAIMRVLTLVDARQGHDDASLIVVDVSGQFQLQRERQASRDLLPRLLGRFRKR